jgi:protein-disulfide isomerase
MAAADATGVRIGTPAFFLNGHLLLGAVPLSEFTRQIDALLQAHP